MIETYKLVHNITDNVSCNILVKHTESFTRGNDHKLYQQRARTEKRKHFFSIRVVKMWNQLPNSVVNAPNTDTFKKRLDKHWNAMPMKYDCNEEPTRMRPAIQAYNLEDLDTEAD